MHIFAYVDQRYQNATRKVVGEGATLLTSPPIYAADFNPEWLEGYDLIYLDLHGQPGSVYLYSGEEGRMAALSLKVVRAARLGGAVVFATTCHLPNTHFLDAFLDAGASAVIAGMGLNWGKQTRASGAQLLAMLTIRAMKAGKAFDVALADAKARLRFSLQRLLDRDATEDALAFQAYIQGDSYGRNGA